MRGDCKRANGRASGPVLTYLFLFVPDHSGGGGVMEYQLDDEININEEVRGQSGKNEPFNEAQY